MTDRPLPAGGPHEPEDGHPRVELRQRHLAATSATRCRCATKVVALRDIKTEVELGYDVQLALKEAHRCLNCDVQTVFASQLCIECDACVDICPMDCITFTANARKTELRTRLTAPARQSDAGSLRRRRAQDRPRHGEGRGRLPALRSVRRALSDRRLGHAEILIWKSTHGG